LTRPRSQILYIYGGFVRRLGGWLPVATLLDLMADLGVEPAAVRAAVARMNRAGLLAAQRQDGLAGYALTAKSWQILDEGDRRILTARDAAALAEGWVLVIFSVPETERHKRHRLRTQLRWLGFGAIASGAWLAPRRLRPELESVLLRSGLLEYTERFNVASEDVHSSRALADKCWNLAELNMMYHRFVASWSHGADASVAPRWAFQQYIALVADWRRLPYLDPGLPSEVLPDDWSGDCAKVVYFKLLGSIDAAALDYVKTRTVERTRL
jgi:phenylacetic acid degradation operon negative regulatory protein